MSSKQVISPSNSDFYFINVDGANNRRKLFNNSDYISTSNVLQRRGSDGLEIHSFSQDFNAFEQILSNQSLKNKEVEISERQDKINSRLELALDEQLIKSLEQSQIIKEPEQNDKEKTDSQQRKQSRVNEIARTKSKKELNYQDIQQIIQSNQKKTQYISQKVKTIQSNQQKYDDDDKPFSLGNGVAAEYYEYENNQADEQVNSQKNEEGTEGSKLKNQIIIFSYLLQFVKALLVRYMYKEPKMLSVLQYRIIGDNSIIIEKNQRKIIEEIQSVKHRNIFDRINFIRQINFVGSNVIKYHKSNKLKQFLLNIALTIKKFLKQFSSVLIILKPNNPFIILWEAIFLIVILFFLLIIPLEWSFDFPSSVEDIFKKMNIVQVSVFILDIIIGFHTGFYEFGEIVMSRSRIHNQYFKQKFKHSFISTTLVITNLIIDYRILNFIALLIMINTINEKMEKIYLNLQLYQRLSNYMELGKLFFLIILLIHIFGCVFHYIGNYCEQIGITDNWLRLAKLQHKSIGERYVNSIYFTMISMVTIGYGEIHPTNVYEKIYVIGMCFLSCGLFAFSVNLIGTTIQDIKRKTKEFRHKQYQISCYMNDRQVQKTTQIRVLKYLEFVEDFRDHNITEGAKILEQCSSEIKEELLKEYFGRILKNIKLFKGTFSKEFLNQLSLLMKERRFAPGEILVQKGSQMKQLYFITKGQTEYFISNNENFINICDYDEKMIDLKCFLTQQPSEVSIRSKGITTVAYIDFQQWQDIVRQFQYEKEKVCCLRDQFLYDKRYQYPCKSCGQYRHNIFNCPQVCFKVNRTIFFNKLTHYVPQDTRKPFARRDKKKQQQSFISNEIIRQGLKLFRWQMVKEIYEDYEETDIQQECAMIEKDREFYQRCPKIKLSHFKKKEKQRYIIYNNNQVVKFKGRQLSKQRSDSNFFYNQKLTSSSSSSSFISSSDSEESSSGSELYQKENQQIQQQEQNQNNSNSNNLLNTPNTNLIQMNLQPIHLQLESKVDYSEVQTEGITNTNQYHKKSSSELQFQNNHFHPRHSKTVNNGRTPKNSRIDNFEGFSSNINSPFPQQMPNPSYFYEQNSQKNLEDNLNPQTYLNNPQQQLIIADKLVTHRRSILSNSNMTINNYSTTNKGQHTQPSSFQPKEENQNILKLNYENSRSLQDDDPYIQASSQVNSLNTPQQQDPSGSPVINLNQIFYQFQQHIQGFYHQLQGLQNHQNQFFPQQNGNQQNNHQQNQQNMQLINKRKKRPMTRFNLPSNLTPNERSQSESTAKDHFRQTSLNSQHKTGQENQVKENSNKVEYQQNEKQKQHLFGKFEFYFDFPREFLYYYPKYNQSNILKTYKKYQTMVLNQYKDSLTMSKKGTSVSKHAMYQSTRRKFPKKHSLAHIKNKKTFIN